MNTYLRLTAMVIVLISFSQASAQDDVLCDISWWQHLQEGEVSSLNEGINNSNLYGRCNEDGDTPLIIAYRAKVSDNTIVNLLQIVAFNAIKNFVSAQNVHGESFPAMLLKEEYEGEDAIFYVDVDVSMGVRKGEF